MQNLRYVANVCILHKRLITRYIDKHGYLMGSYLLYFIVLYFAVFLLINFFTNKEMARTRKCQRSQLAVCVFDALS